MQTCPTPVLRGSSSSLRGQQLQQQQRFGPQQQRVPGRGFRTVRTALEADSPASSSGNTAPEGRTPEGLSARVHLIPQSRWEDGIPPVMGAHLMASGTVSPISTSKGVGRAPDAFAFYYPNDKDDYSVLQFASAQDVASGLADLLASASAKAVAARGAFAVALSGGSAVDALSALVGRSDVAFDKWHVFFVDERNVALDSADSNYAAADGKFLKASGVPDAQVYKIKPGLPVAEAATSYAGRMIDLPVSVLPRTAASLPALDAVVLGVGPDGHVASLFPNRAALADKSGAWVLPVANSPKPPAERITFSLPVINAAKEVLFVAHGASKADVVQRVLEVQALPGALPAQMVRPQDGSVTWLVDSAAAAELRAADWQTAKTFPRSQLDAGKK